MGGGEAKWLQHRWRLVMIRLDGRILTDRTWRHWQRKPLDVKLNYAGIVPECRIETALQLVNSLHHQR